MVEVSRRKLGICGAFFTASALSIAVVSLTDPLSLIALSSRVFALFYVMQVVLAL